MQRPGQHPVRPLPIQGQPDLQQLLELARASGMQQSRSAFSTVPGGAAPFPEFSLYNAAQLSGLLGNNAGVQLDQLAQIQQLQNLQSQAGAAALLGSGQAVPESSTSRNSAGKGVSRGDKSSSAYASRHQAAEQRRRTRINDRSASAIRNLRPSAKLLSKWLSPVPRVPVALCFKSFICTLCRDFEPTPSSRTPT